MKAPLKVLEFESPDGRQTRDPENPGMEKELRVCEEGARDDTGKGNLARHRSRVPDSQKDDPRDE